MSTFIIDFNAPDFAALRGVRYKDEWTNFADKNLPGTFRDALTMLLSVAGVPFDGENNTLLIKSKAGLFDRTYSPAVYNKEGVVTIRWGKLAIPLQAFIDGGADVSLAEVGNGDVKDYVVTILVLEADGYPDGISMNFALRIEGELKNRPSFQTFVAAFKSKNSKEKFPPMLQAFPTGEGGNTKKLQDLGIGEFEVIGYSCRSGGQFGDSYSVHLSESKENGEFAGLKVYANKSIQPQLQAGVTISPAMPATLVISDIKQNKTGKTVVDCALLTAVGSLKTGTDALVLAF